MKKLFYLAPLLFLLAAGCTQSSTNQQTGQTGQPASPPTRVQPRPQEANSANKSSQQDETKNWKTYTNSQYGFEIKFPLYWEGYKTDMRKFDDGGTSIGFDFPYTFNGAKVYYEDALQIIVYSKSVWPSVRNLDGSKREKFAENSNYVFDLARGRDLGGHPELERADDDMDKIFSTFKLIK